jgi:hypothetical protein
MTAYIKDRQPSTANWLVSCRTLFMPIELSHSQVVVLIRQAAFERAGITRKAIDLCAGCEGAGHLEALLDDSPILDVSDTVLDPVDHHIRISGQQLRAQSPGRQPNSSPQVFLRDFSVTRERDLAGDDCELALNVIVFVQRRCGHAR